jgi:aspartyl-tRNA synthetase
MKLTAISKLKFKRKSTIQGFVVSIRNKTNIAFLVVKDFSSKIQITINKTITPQFNELIDRLTIQSVITVVGQMHENPQVKLNGREFIPSKIILETKAATPLPVDDNSLLDQRLDYR